MIRNINSVGQPQQRDRERKGVYGWTEAHEPPHTSMDVEGVQVDRRVPTAEQPSNDVYNAVDG